MGSTLFNEQHCWVAKVTLQAKDGSGSTSFYIGTEHYGSGKIYSASPVVYPVVKSFNPTRRGFEREAAIRYDISIEIDANCSFQEWGKTFADLADAYEFHGGAVELRFYLKPTHTTTTHSDSVNIMQTLEIVRADLSDDQNVMTLVCRDTWFKDRELSKKLESADFTDLQEEWLGRYGSWIFGKDPTSTFSVIIDAPFIDSAAQPKLFAGWVTAGHYMNEASTIFVKHSPNEFNDNNWVTCELNPSPSFFGDNGSSTSTSVNLANGSVGYVVTTPSTGAAIAVLAQGSFYFSGVGTMTADMGRLAAKVFYSVDNQPVGNALAEALFDITSIHDAGATVVSAYFDKPALVTFGQNFFIELSWSGSDTANSVIVTAGTESGRQYYYNNKTGGAFQAASANEFFSLGVHLATRHATYFDDGSGNDQFAWFRFSSNYNDLLRDNLQFKIGLKGLEDSSGNTYGAGASTLLSNPARLIDFMLRSSAGIGLASGSVDTSAISTVATSLDTAGYAIGAAIDQQMMVSEFILELCRHGRLTLFKTKAGKISLHNPANFSAFPTKVSWARYQREVEVLGLKDDDPANVTNDIFTAYDIDEINRPKDAAALRKGQPNQFSANFELNGSSADSTRAAAATASIALYGKRERRATLPYYSSSTDAASVENYNFDRFHKSQKRLIIEVPLRDFYSAIDLFSDIIVEHLDIPVAGGSKPLAKLFLDTGSGTRYQLVTAYYEATPALAWEGGRFCGRVVEIAALGSTMTLTLETLSPFASN